MANEFTPFLQEASVSNISQTPVSNTSLSGIGQTISNIFRNTANQKAEEEEKRSLGILSEFAQDMNILKNARDENIVQQQEYENRINQLMADGAISSEERREADYVMGQLKKLSEFRRVGLGNDRVADIQRRTLLNRTLERSPALIEVFKSEFVNEGFVKDSSGTTSKPENMLNKTAYDNAVSQFGENVTPEQVFYEKKRLMRLANQSERLAQGVATAAEINNNMSAAVLDIMTPIYNKFSVLAYNQGGVLRPGQQEEFSAAISGIKQSVKHMLSSQLTANSNTDTTLITADEAKSLQQNLDREFEFYENFVKQNDFLAKTERFNKIRELGTDFLLDEIGMGVAKRLGGVGGVDNLDKLVTILGDNSIKSVVTALDSSREHLRGVRGDVNRLLAETVQLIVDGVQIDDPALNRLQKTLGLVFTKKGVMPNTVGRDTDGTQKSGKEYISKEQAAANGNPLATAALVDKLNPGRTERVDALFSTPREQSIGDERLATDDNLEFSRLILDNELMVNYNKTANPEQKKVLKENIKSFITNLSNGITDDNIRSPRSKEVNKIPVYDKNLGLFVSNDSRLAPSGQRVATRMPSEYYILNNFLKAARSTVTSNYFPSDAELIKMITEAQEEGSRLYEERIQIEAQEEAKRKAEFQAKIDKGDFGDFSTVN